MTRRKGQKQQKQVVLEVKENARNGQNKRRRPQRGRKGGSGNRGAPVSTSIRLASQATEKLRVHGTDRLAHVPDISIYNDGDVALDFLVGALAIPRLARLAEAYQRVVYHRLVFRVEAMAPTSAIGGLVSGFIPDASDNVGTGGEALSRVLAVPGARLFKAWQSVSIAHSCLPDVLYTSVPPVGDIRLSSPGRLVIIVDSKVVVSTSGMRVPLSVYLDWDVTLMEPSLEGKEQKGSAIESKADFYLRSANVGLWWTDDAGGDDPRTKVPGIQFDQEYRLSSKRYIDFGEAGTSGSYDRVMLVNDTTHGVTFAPVDYKGKPMMLHPARNMFFIERGDVLVPEIPNPQLGLQICRPPYLGGCGSRPSKLSTPSGSLESLSKSFEKM